MHKADKILMYSLNFADWRRVEELGYRLRFTDVY